VDARLIGIISKAHGVRGEVVVQLLTDYPNTIKKGDKIYLDEKCTRMVEIERIRLEEQKRNKLYSLIKFKGIDDREHAIKLNGESVFRREKDTPELSENQYWTDDIIGSKVYTKENVFIGVVIDVEKLISNDNLAVRIDNRELNVIRADNDIFYIPIIKDYIKNINIKDKKIILKRIPEYI
jgi:16S rRNA processing protein RimM